MGYIFGGIVSSVPNTSSRLDSTASPEIFSVIITPVPEPSTCAIALAGLACGGLAIWRRRPRRLNTDVISVLCARAR